MSSSCDVDLLCSAAAAAADDDDDVPCIGYYSRLAVDDTLSGRQQRVSAAEVRCSRRDVVADAYLPSILRSSPPCRHHAAPMLAYAALPPEIEPERTRTHQQQRLAEEADDGASK